MAAFAQNAPLTGKVELKKADGTTEPVQGAMVEVYRTDIKSKGPTAKTNKKGEFSFAGLQLGATFVLVVSGDKINPTYQPNIRAGANGVIITASEGDGKRLTEEEVRTALTSGPPAANNTTPAKPTEDQKKAQAERAKLEAEYEANKKKVESETAIINRA
ncbi:MAG: SpaA isopeptide-forming pilin-related protein, partial [Pyrinomonadaceae bacterium]